jgi:4-aminobutyrate aminotransferase
MMGKLNDLKAKYHVIGDVRGSGFMVGVEFVDPTNLAPAAAFMEEFEQLGFQKGVLFLGCGTSTIRLAPPLIVTQHEIDVMIDVMEQCLEELSKKYSY